MEKESKEIKDLSFEEFEKAFPDASKNGAPKNKSLLKTLFLFPFKFFGAILGIDKKTIVRNSSIKNSYNMPNYPHHDNWKEQYRADPPPVSHAPNPYTYDPVAYDNLRIYLQGQDGKGDPRPPCDCDHDR